MLVGHLKKWKADKFKGVVRQTVHITHKKSVSKVFSSWLIEIHTISVSGDSGEWEVRIMESKKKISALSSSTSLCFMEQKICFRESRYCCALLRFLIRSLHELREMNTQRANCVSISVSMSQYWSCSKDFRYNSFKLYYLLANLILVCIDLSPNNCYYGEWVKINWMGGLCSTHREKEIRSRF